MSEVITFYSYKGGVGRTMALANVSVMLAKWGHKVLVVDWDLEAPGLEHFYKDYINASEEVATKIGVVDLLQFDESVRWQDGLIDVKISDYNESIHLLSSGRRDEEYFKKVRNFNVDTFYEHDGGDVIEKLRDEWLANYDYVLIDSRTGITEIGGICTIQLPDTVVMLFTATEQGFDGVLDIMKRASAAQQKLPYDRQKLFFLPIPSKFETNTEFKLSQEWLLKFADKLGPTFDDWLPGSVDRKDFLELTKIPYISYFSFGEKLPVIEQGVKDPAGLGYAYETLAAVIGNHLLNVDWLFHKRDHYISVIDNFDAGNSDLTTNEKNVDFDSAVKKFNNTQNIKENPFTSIWTQENILICIGDVVLPIFNKVSENLSRTSHLFNYKSESIQIFGEHFYKNEHNYSWNKQENNSTLKDLPYNISNIYLQYEKYNIFEIQFKYNFGSLRNHINNGNSCSDTISVKFLDNLLNIQGVDSNLFLSKEYHGGVLYVESESIAESISVSIFKNVTELLNKMHKY